MTVTTTEPKVALLRGVLESGLMTPRKFVVVGEEGKGLATNSASMETSASGISKVKERPNSVPTFSESVQELKRKPGLAVVERVT